MDYLVQVGAHYIKQRGASLKCHYSFKEKPQCGWSGLPQSWCVMWPSFKAGAAPAKEQSITLTKGVDVHQFSHVRISVVTY